MRSAALRAWTIFLSASLTACGGGGGRPNTSPVASNATLQTTEDQSGSVSVTVTDADNDRLTTTISAAPAKGTATVSGSGPFVFIYTPNPDANGADSFRYQVNDGRGGAASGEVSVNIAAVADPPSLESQSFSVDEDSTLHGRIVARDPDGDALTLTIATTTADGTLQLDDPASGQFTYQPSANFNGADTFTVRVTDGSLDSATVEMAINVQPTNDPPVAAGDKVVLPLAATSSIDVLANDSDIDGDPLAVEIVAQPPGASATVVGTQISITPAASAAGPTSLMYRVTDSAGGVSMASVRIIFGSMTPLFLSAYQASTDTGRIYRYDYFSRTAIDTPVPAGEKLAGFTTDAGGTRMVFTTFVPGPPARTRLWLKDLTDASAPVQEIRTSGNFFVRTLELSPDGNHVVFNDQYAPLSRPDQPVAIDANVERPRFTKDSRNIFYVVISSGGGRVINRASIDLLSGGLTGRTQVTATYATAEGLGIDYTLTPDETKVVSAGLFFVPPFTSVKQNAYVSPASGASNDVQLHPQFTNIVDHASQPAVTADSRYAYYLATLGGTSGIYATDLQAPGTSVRIDVNPGGAYAHSPIVAADSRTLFYALDSLPATRQWFYTTIDQPAISTPFAPLGSSSPANGILPAPDGSAVVFVAGGRIYATSAPFTSAMALGALVGNGNGAIEIKYAQDSNTIAVLLSSSAEQIQVLNPRIPGWSDSFYPTTADTVVSCFAFPGGSC